LLFVVRVLAVARRAGNARETYDALARVEALVSPLPAPEEAEHHYRYDPAKSEAYLATTLSWIGDPGAERYARQVLARIESPSDGRPHPRRAATARLDLALALATTGRLDEAAQTALDAVTSRLPRPAHAGPRNRGATRSAQLSATRPGSMWPVRLGPNVRL
jgi:hypothetical protein